MATTTSAPHFQRQALRLAVGGRPVLGDLDDLSATATGWDRATASHNTVVVDGLNQGEVLARAEAPTPGGDFLFFAADPDFQVATLDDPRAYPRSTTRYRQTIVAASGSAGLVRRECLRGPRRRPARPGLPRRPRLAGALADVDPDGPGAGDPAAAVDPVRRLGAGRGRPMVRPVVR